MSEVKPTIRIKNFFQFEEIPSSVAPFGQVPAASGWDKLMETYSRGADVLERYLAIDPNDVVMCEDGVKRTRYIYVSDHYLRQPRLSATESWAASGASNLLHQDAWAAVNIGTHFDPEWVRIL